MIFDRKIVRRIAGVVPAQMFACGLAWIAADVMRLGYMRGSIFLASLCAILLLNVVFYNRFTKAVGALALGVGAGVFIYLGVTGGMADRLALLAEEVVGLLGRGVGDDELRLLVGRVLGVVAGAAAFCTAGSLRGGVVMGLTTIAAFCAAWYSGERSIFGSMALCASATAAVSAAGFARRRVSEIERALEGEQAPTPAKERKGARRHAQPSAVGSAKASAVGAVGSPTGIALFAIPVVLVLAIAGTLFRPTVFARGLRVRAVEGALDDAIDSIAQNFEGFTRRTTVFSLGAVGYGPAADLGGPVELLEDTMLIVDVNRPGYLHYLRGSVRSVYDGNGWRDGELGGSYRFESRLWDEQREDAFDILRGGMPEANSYFLAAYERVGYAVRHASHFTSMFTLDRPEEVESRLYTPYFNLQGELFPKGSMEMYANYSVSGYAMQSMTRSVARNIAKMVERYAPDEEYVRSEFEEKVYAEYLPDGEVEITVAEGERMIAPADGEALAQGVYLDEDFGWVQTPRAYLASADYLLGAYILPESEAMLADAKDWNYHRADEYYLFYGYTAEDMEKINENAEAIEQRQAWLDEHRAAEYHAELMAEFKATLEWPKPQEIWMTEAQMAVYGMDTGDSMWDAGVYYPEDEYPFWPQKSGMREESLVGEAYRSVTRREFYVSTESTRLRYEANDEGGYEIVVDDGASSGVGQTGFYTSENAQLMGSGSMPGMTRIAEENGFERLEFAEKVTYYPGVAEEFANMVALGYLTTLDDDGEVNKFEMLLEVAKAIDANSTYTLMPTTVPDGVDFVDWFMSTNEGYCTYYASAMVVMARELGVPARYAEGYALDGAERAVDDDGRLTNTYTLTGYDAHAWAEVWFDGVGWVVLDPLGLDALELEDVEQDELPDIEVEMPVPSLEPTVEPIVEDEPDDVEEDGGLPWWAAALIVAGAVLFAAVFTFAMVRVLVVRTRALARLRRKYGDRGAAKHLWTEILCALEMIEPLCVRGDGETASEFAERVKGLVFVEGVPFVEVARAAEVAWYAAREINEGELGALDRCAKEMRRLMFRRAPLRVFWMMK